MNSSRTESYLESVKLLELPLHLLKERPHQLLMLGWIRHHMVTLVVIYPCHHLCAYCCCCCHCCRYHLHCHHHHPYCHHSSSPLLPSSSPSLLLSLPLLMLRTSLRWIKLNWLEMFWEKLLSPEKPNHKFFKAIQKNGPGPAWGNIASACGNFETVFITFESCF